MSLSSIPKRGVLLDAHAKAAKRFPSKALRGLKNREKPLKTNTDKAPA